MEARSAILIQKTPFDTCSSKIDTRWHPVADELQIAGAKMNRTFRCAIYVSMDHLRNSWKTLLFSSIFFLWTFNCLLAAIDSGLDGSWMLGLNWAGSQGWQWGRDIVFIYGPLHWLYANISPAFQPMPLVIGGILAFNLAATACAGYLFSKFVPKEFGVRDLALLFLVSVSLLFWNARSTPLELFFIFAMVLFVEDLHKRQTETRNSHKFTSRISLMVILTVFVLSQYIKFNYFPVSIILLLLMAFSLCVFRRIGDAAMLILAYPVLSLLIWCGLGQSPANLPHYMQWGLAFSGGYTEAMQVNFSGPEIYQAWILVLILGLLYGIAGIRFIYHKQFAAAFSWFLPAPLFFMLFKEGFVRADIHAEQMYLALPLCLIYLLYVSGIHWPMTTIPEKRYLSYSIAGVAILCIAASHFLFNLSFLPDIQFGKFRKVITGNYAQPDDIRTSLRPAFNLEKNFLGEIDPQASIDIFPYEISLLYAYGFPWSPRPLLQSNITYIPALDAMNAAHFYGPQAPQQILWRSDSIDGKYPAFDEPLVFRALLDRYTYISKERSNRFALLRLDSQRMERPWIVVGGVEQHRLNEPILIPDLNNCHLYMRVQISPNLLGGVMNIFYKAPYPTMVIRTRDGRSFTYRFLRALGTEGFFVSKYITNAEDLRSVMQEEYSPDIESIQFIGSRWFYSQTVSVQFYSVPFPKG
jgi:hypothetical protein